MFNERTVDGVTAHQLALASALQLDYAELGKLLSVGASTGPTSTLSAITDDLKRVGAVGLSSTRGVSDSTAQVSIQVP